MDRHPPLATTCAATRRLADHQVSPAVLQPRRSPRVHLVALSAGAVPSYFFAGVCEELSEGGVFVATDAPPPVGAAVMVRIEALVRAFQPLVEFGRVTWHHQDLNGDPTGCGVSFVDLDDRSRAVLGWMMAQVDRQPQFWERQAGADRAGRGR